VSDPVTLQQIKALLRRHVPQEETDWWRFTEQLRSLGRDVRAPKQRTAPYKKQPRTWVLAGDDQAPFVNWPLHELTCEAWRDIGPDGWVHMGDGVDFGIVSKYRKPGTRFDDTINQGTQTLHRVVAERQQAKGAGDDWYLLGNHCVRWQKAVQRELPAAVGLKPADAPDDTPQLLSLDHLAGLSRLGMTVVYDERGDYPYGTVRLTPDLIITHGFTVRQGAGASALAALKNVTGSIAVGHTHRLAVSHLTRWEPDETPRVFTAAETGALCDLEGLGYDRFPDWQPGWLTVTVTPDGGHHFDVARYDPDQRALRWRGAVWRLTTKGIRSSH
jgi:hypothetical protein